MKKLHSFNLLYYTPKLWEKVILWFCPMESSETPNSIVWYKKFYNRMYICGYIRVTRLGTLDNTDEGYDNAENN